LTGDVGSCVPPSAAGHLEPYGVRLTLQPTQEALAIEQFLTTLLQELAAACLDSGGSVIGHLKSVLYTSRGAMACNLTSLRAGAACSRGRGPDGDPLVLGPGEAARLDLAVLVYGIPAMTIDALVRRVLVVLLDPKAVRWSPGDLPTERV
jgi:hypothetical protein